MFVPQKVRDAVSQSGPPGQPLNIIAISFGMGKTFGEASCHNCAGHMHGSRLMDRVNTGSATREDPALSLRLIATGLVRLWKTPDNGTRNPGAFLDAKHATIDAVRKSGTQGAGRPARSWAYIRGRVGNAIK